MDKKGKNINRGNVIVTGASRGIGEACVLALLKAGFRVLPVEGKKMVTP